MATKTNSIYYFNNAGTRLNGATIPTSDFNTNALQFKNYSGPWQIEVFRSGTDGSVTFTVQYSSDNSNWYPLDEGLIDLDLDGNNSVRPPIQNNELWPEFIRLSFTISNNPTGTIVARFIKVDTEPSR